MSSNPIHNDGRRGRDADGDGIYDEKNKKGTFSFKKGQTGHPSYSLPEPKEDWPNSSIQKRNLTVKMSKMDSSVLKRELDKIRSATDARSKWVVWAGDRTIALRNLGPKAYRTKAGPATTFNDGRKGRDADGDGIYDEKGKNITKTHRVLKGGFVLRKPDPKKRKARGWRVVKGAHKAIEKVAKREAVMAAKDIPLVGVQKKKGIKFQEPIDRKSLSPRDRDRLDRGLPVKTGFKPGEAYKFKTVKIDKNAPRFKMAGKGKKVLLGQVLRGRPLEYDEKALKKAIKTAITKKMSDLPRFNRDTKINYLVDNSVFMEKDIPWLNTLNTRQLDILIISNYGTSDGVKKSWTTRKRMGGGFSGTYRKEVRAPETEEERRRRLNVRRRAARGRWADSMFGPKP